jgi:hypothetical protein
MSTPTTTKLLALSAKGLATIPWEHYEHNFKFQLRTSEYFCPSFVAEFLSPRISKLRSNDVTVQEFRLQPVDSTQCFEPFLFLGFGSSLFINSEESSIFQKISVELGAGEFYEQLFEYFEGEMTPQNICERLQNLEGLKFSCEREIAFAASHFTNLNSVAIENLNVSLLFQILNHDFLQIQSEDWLFEIVLSLISKGHNYCSLLELIGYEYLSKSSIESFIDLISESFEFLTSSIW